MVFVHFFRRIKVISREKVNIQNGDLDKKQNKFYVAQMVKEFSNGGVLQINFSELKLINRPTIVQASACNLPDLILAYDFDQSLSVITLRAYNASSKTAHNGIVRFSLIAIP